MNDTLTAAIIGSGYIGKRHIAAYKKLGHKIVVCSNDIETGQKLAEEYNAKYYEDYHEMLQKEKLDLVSVCLPTYLHYDATMAALDSHVNVLCEKPLSLNSEDARKMVSRAQEKGLLFMIGHCVRFSQPYEYLKHCVKDLRFGKLTYLNLFRHGVAPGWSVGNWFENTALSGGALRDLHIHDTDIVVSTLGMPKAVYTTGNAFACSTVYTYDEANLSVTGSASWRKATDAPPQVGYDAIFENGTVQFRNGVFEAYDQNGKVESALESEEFGAFFAPLGEDPIKYEIAYFCDCLTKKATPEICLCEDSLKSVITNCAETESLNSRVSINIP